MKKFILLSFMMLTLFSFGLNAPSHYEKIGFEKETVYPEKNCNFNEVIATKDFLNLIKFENNFIKLLSVPYLQKNVAETIFKDVALTYQGTNNYLIKTNLNYFRIIDINKISYSKQSANIKNYLAKANWSSKMLQIGNKKSPFLSKITPLPRV